MFWQCSEPNPQSTVVMHVNVWKTLHLKLKNTFYSVFLSTQHEWSTSCYMAWVGRWIHENRRRTVRPDSRYTEWKLRLKHFLCRPSLLLLLTGQSTIPNCVVVRTPACTHLSLWPLTVSLPPLPFTSPALPWGCSHHKLKVSALN